MPYTPTSYTTGGTATAANLDNGETQYTEATNSFEQDLFTPFVFSGLVATKDGTTLSQLDVTTGVAFLRQSSDSTLRRRAPTATTFSASGHASSTLYLDLQPDGTWSWGTAHSGVSGYLAIAQVTTDASSNIATVTDKRTLNTTLLSGMAGGVTLPGNTIIAGGATLQGSLTVDGLTIVGGASAASTQFAIQYYSPVSAVEVVTPQTGGAQGVLFATWSGSAEVVPFSVGGQFGSAVSWVNAGGQIYEGGSRVALQGQHSAGQPALSYGSGAPSALNANEIYFQVS